MKMGCFAAGCNCIHKHYIFTSVTENIKHQGLVQQTLQRKKYFL